jgi:O-antigen ligase
MRTLDRFFCAAFAFTILFPVRAPNFFIFLYAAYAVYEAIKGRNFRLKMPPALATLPAFFIVNVISILLSDNRDGISGQIEKYSAFILIPFLLRLRNEHITWSVKDAALRFFVAGCLTATVFNIGRAFYQSLSLVDGNLVFNAAVVGNQDFVRSVVYGGNHFFYDDYSYFLHPTYLSAYLIFAIGIVVYYLTTGRLAGRINRILALTVAAWFCVNLYLLSSRGALITFGVISLVFSFVLIRNFISKIRWWHYVSIAALLVVAGYILINNPRIQMLLKQGGLFENNTRLTIWKCGFSIARSKFMTGVGLMDVHHELDKAYKEINFLEGVDLQYNLHNQYLEEVVASGVTGLAALLIMLAILMYHALKQRNGLLGYILFIYSVNFLFESMLNVYAGIVFFSFWVSMLMARSGQKDSPDHDLSHF